jgi:hypothetical protein
LHFVERYVGNGKWERDTLYSLLGYRGSAWSEDTLKVSARAMINTPNLKDFGAQNWRGEFWLETIPGCAGTNLGVCTFGEAIKKARDFVAAGSYKENIWLVGGDSNLKVAEVYSQNELPNAFINAKGNFKRGA